MSDSYYYHDGDRGGGAGPSSFSCWRCKKEFSTMMALTIHCNKQTDCAVQGHGGGGSVSGRGSRSGYARGSSDFADLDQIARLPSLSGSEGHNHRSDRNRSGYSRSDSRRNERIRKNSSRKSASNASSAFRNLGSLVHLPSLSGSSRRSPYENTIPPGAQTDTQVLSRYGCEQCEKTFLNIDSLRNHISFKHSDRPLYQCNVCHRYFLKHDSVRRHKMKMHSEDGALKCRKCDTRFTRTDSMRRHMRNYHAEGSGYPCRDCGEVFINKKLRTEHTANVHEKEYEYECKYCGRTFARQDTVRRHLRQAHGKKKTSADEYNRCRK